MPDYTYCCATCGNTTIYTCSITKNRPRMVCGGCGAPMYRDFASDGGASFMGHGDFSRMNGGKGYKAKQLDAESGDKVFFQSKREYVDYLKGPHAEKVARTRGREVEVTTN